MCEVHVHEQRNEKTDKIIFFSLCVLFMMVLNKVQKKIRVTHFILRCPCDSVIMQISTEYY